MKKNVIAGIIMAVCLCLVASVLAVPIDAFRVKILCPDGTAKTVIMHGIILDVDMTNWTSELISVALLTNGLPALILLDPDSQKWAVTVDTNGVLHTTKQ